MPLIASDRITGTLVTYIDALGRKSLAPPNRRRLDLEPAPGAMMEIAAASPGTIDIRVDVITCEGWENEEHHPRKEPGAAGPRLAWDQYDEAFVLGAETRRASGHRFSKAPI